MQLKSCVFLKVRPHNILSIPFCIIFGGAQLLQKYLPDGWGSISRKSGSSVVWISGCLSKTPCGEATPPPCFSRIVALFFDHPFSIIVFWSMCLYKLCFVFYKTGPQNVTKVVSLFGKKLILELISEAVAWSKAPRSNAQTKKLFLESILSSGLEQGLEVFFF